MSNEQRAMSNEAGQPSRLSFSEKAQEKDTVDNMVDRLMDEADLDPVISPIKKLIEEAKSMEELRDSLLDEYKNLDVVELGNLIQKAFTAAEMMGRFEAKP